MSADFRHFGVAVAALLFSLAFGPSPVSAQDAQQPPSPGSSGPPSKSVERPKHVLVPARLLREVQPAYPKKAKKAKVCGSVILHAIITKEGMPAEIKYVSGPLELVESATTAVEQWRYAPTLVDGLPVPVNTKITVIFELKGCTPQNDPVASAAR